MFVPVSSTYCCTCMHFVLNILLNEVACHTRATVGVCAILYMCRAIEDPRIHLNSCCVGCRVKNNPKVDSYCC